MFLWPNYLVYALGEVGYEGGPEDEGGPEAFLGRWGGVDVETLARVLKEGQGEDRLLALFALGYAAPSWARELLLPFLHSAQPQERWASAMSLGRMKEEQALFPLTSMLTEFLPPPEHPGFEGELWLYNNWRSEVILILAEWGRAEIIPALFQALKVFQQLEQAISESHDIQRRYWRECGNEVIYALGWLGRFEVLTAFEVAEPVLDCWRVYLILGSLHAHSTYQDIFQSGLWTKPALRTQVAALLHQRFGFSGEEQERCLATYQRRTPF